MMKLFDSLKDPCINQIDLNSQNRLTVHSEILGRKKILRQVFEDFHHAFQRLDRQYFTAQGMKIEIGAGVAPIKHTYRDVLATDIVEGELLDLTIDAENMDLPDNSVRAFYGQNCFHHFPHPELFFNEVNRTLLPGGGVILLEPYYGPVATLLYKHLFSTEFFNKRIISWETTVEGPMQGANQALSYIIFVRDRKIFQDKFPSLKIVHHELCNNSLKYLLSGGLNFKQLIPDWAIPYFDRFQKISSPLNNLIALHHIIVIKKV